MACSMRHTPLKSWENEKALQSLHQRCWVAYMLIRYASLTRVTAYQFALPKSAYPGLPNLAVPALGAWRQNLVARDVG